MKLTSEEKNDYQGLFWFSDMALVIGFRKTFKIFTTRSLFVINSKDGLTRGRFQLFYCPEVDGIRIIAISSDNQAYVYMIRNTPIEYVYVKQQDISLSPVKKLNECYQSYKDGKCPKEMEIIDNN